MSDYISRQAAIDAVIERLDKFENVNLRRDDVIKVALWNVPGHRWTPCSEKLPEETGRYLVTSVISFVPDHVDDPNTYSGVTFAFFEKDGGYWWGNNVEKVLAWMQIPEM